MFIAHPAPVCSAGVHFHKSQQAAKVAVGLMLLLMLLLSNLFAGARTT